MNGTETAVVQIGSIAITSGAAIGILKWLVPYIIQLWADKQKEVAADKRKNLTMSIELEQARKQNSDDAIRANRAMVEILSTAVKSISSDVSSLKSALAHTDAELSTFASYVPLLERIKAALDSIDRKKSAATESQPAAPSKVTEVGNTTWVQDATSTNPVPKPPPKKGG